MGCPKVLPLHPGDALVRWANLTRGFYGHTVWLVGSQLFKDDPRDVDMAVYLPDEEFCLRYGVTDLESWLKNFNWGVFEASHWAWADDMVKKSLHGMRFTSLPIDLKVLPQTYIDRFFPNCDKIQVDTRILEPTVADNHAEHNT